MTKVEKDENDIIKIKVDRLNQQLDAATKLFASQPENEAYAKNIFDIQTKINQVYIDSDNAMRRVESTRTGIMNKVAEDQKELEEQRKKGN